MRALSLIGVAAALVGSFVAFVTYEALCFGESWGSTSCPRGHPSTTMIAQLVLGLLGVLPAVYLVFCVFRGRKRRAVAVLAGGLLLWAAWALLNDAAVHDWGVGMRLIP